MVLYRLNPEFGIGRVVKKLEIPASKSLDDEDTFFITKFKVVFKDNIIKVIHPIDLVHYIFDLNERVITKQGTGVINSNEFLIKDGLVSYEFLLPNGKITQIFEPEIYSRYETPLERVIESKKIDPPQHFLIKYWANLFHSYYTSYQIKCITNSRLSLMPHQINVAHRLSEEHFPRVILADEVGLGKTIEAGIYIKEMMARNLAERILIIVPASLLNQWQFEMQNKFNISFTIYDGKKIKELRKKGSYKSPNLLNNPFYYDNLIICSLQFARNRKYIKLLSQISWDIVIFDEAHHLRRYLLNAMTGYYRETLNYELARNLSQNVESLLLLTATPLQLHSFELYSLIELIHPEVFENYSDFEHFRKNMPFINLLVTNLNQIDKLNNFEVKNTIKLLKNLRYIDKRKNHEQILGQIKINSFKLNLINKIEEDHTLSKFLIRNRKKNVFSKEFLNKRIVKTIMVYPTKQELDLYNEIRLYLAKIYNSSLSRQNAGIGFVIATLQKLLTSSKYAFLKSLERRLEQITRFKDIFLKLDVIKEEDPEYYELELEDQTIDSEIIGFKESISQELSDESLTIINQERILKEFYEKLKNLPYDSKADKLIEIIKEIYSQNSTEKILIFTQFVDTLLHLKALIENQGDNFLIEIFYGGLDKNQKDAAVERFRNSKKFSILISTEIGGEGRNFQFCRILINYDLPWNPMKLEQRIGRLDRIGQESREIYIYNLFMEGTIETDVISALLNRINLFEESIGILEPIIGKIEKDFKNLIFIEDEKKKRNKLNEFYRTLDEEIQKAKEIEMQLDDLMIDKKSFQMEGLITSLASCIDVKLTHNELFLLMKYFFNLDNNKYGYLKFNDIERHDIEIATQTKILLNEILSRNPKYRLSNEYLGTFSLEFARNKEEIDFFALGHPMINSILDYIMGNLISGSFTVLLLKRNALPESFAFINHQYTELYLFIFTIKFQGYIIENQISAVLVDQNGKEVEKLSDFILNIENFEKIFNFSELKYEIDLNYKDIDELSKTAKKIVKLKTSIWKKEIEILNDKLYDLEKNKKEKIYAHKRNVLFFKLNSLKQRLERKQNNRPTERQLQNINKMSDETKKQEKLDNIQKLEEEIKYIEKDIKNIEKKLDDLSFEYEDLKQEMIKKNIAKFYTNLLSFAVIKLTQS
ncbi:MAG: SNF2-related protein [Candidatus Hodarchaeota archaeon]